MYRGFEILTECIEVFIHCMMHTLYVSYIVWFYIDDEFCHALYGGAYHTLYGGEPREPPPQTYLDTDQKSHGSPRAKNCQNHNQK